LWRDGKTKLLKYLQVILREDKIVAEKNYVEDGKRTEEKGSFSRPNCREKIDSMNDLEVFGVFATL